MVRILACVVNNKNRFAQNGGNCCSIFWRERSDDCFKTRVAAQRIPKGMETQMSVAQMAARQLRYLGQSFNCAILVARPRINDSQVLGQHRTLDGAFADGQQLDRALAFADGVLLISKSSINHTEGAESRCIVALTAHHLVELHSRVDKRGTSCRLIATEPGGKTLAPTVREWNVFVETPAPTGRHGGQCALSCVGVALA